MSDVRPSQNSSDLIPAALEAAATLAGAAKHPGLPKGAQEKCGRAADRLWAALTETDQGETS